MAQPGCLSYWMTIQQAPNRMICIYRDVKYSQKVHSWSVPSYNQQLFPRHDTLYRPLSNKYLWEPNCPLISPNSHQQATGPDGIFAQTLATVDFFFVPVFLLSPYWWGNECVILDWNLCTEKFSNNTIPYSEKKCAKSAARNNSVGQKFRTISLTACLFELVTLWLNEEYLIG